MSESDHRATRRRALLGAVLAMAATAWAPSALAGIHAPVAPEATPEPPYAPGVLQGLIDDTPRGGTLVVPAGLYRESVTISLPIVIDGSAAEIRGSDAWDAWRETGNGTWRSSVPIPDLDTGGVCLEERCAWPEQVFLDGTALTQVADAPGPGEFAVDAQRHVLLADEPAGHVIEVTTRPRWVEVEAPDVELRGFTMRHVASPAQSGGIQSRRGADRLTVREVVLEDAHGALISFQDVDGAALLDSELRRGGQLAVHVGGDGTRRLTVARNRLLDSNTEGFDPAWEAGGLKAALSSDLVLEDNVVTGNDGPGLWCDIDCRDVHYVGNRVSHNTGAGIFFDISDGAVIEDNIVWENGWDHPTWGWGAGILVSSSTAAVVRDNVLAWNADGISIISQRRDRAAGDAVRGISVASNTVINGPAGGFLLAWLQDWDGPLFADDGGNSGTGNAFWVDADEADTCDFEWDGCRDTVASFASTPGGRDSRLLDIGERDTVLASAGIVEAPMPHEVEPEPLRLREFLRPSVLLPVAVGGLIVIVLAVAVATRRRNRREA